MKKSTKFLLITACITILSCKQKQTAPNTFKVPNTKPNIILIMSDQQRGDAIGLVNHNVITPNIDKLAGDGVWFKNGYSSVPSCTPARTILMTGLSPWHNGMLGFAPKTAVYRKYEMPQLLREAGYYTCGIGKMHWNPQRYKRGFHEMYLDECGRVKDPDFISDYRVWFKKQTNDSLNPDATGIGWNENRAGIYKLPENLHPTTWTGQKAVDFIKSYNYKKPMFLKVSFARPHSPYDPPKRYLDMYKNTPITTPTKSDWSAPFKDYNNTEKTTKLGKESSVSGYNTAFGDMGDAFARNSIRHYYANITFIDDKVGEIIKALKEKNMYNNAIIIFISDHGDMLGDHYHWRKTYAYQGSANIPFVFKYPKKENSYIIKKGTQMKQVVELRDVLPTFLDAAGISIPSDLDGKSLFNLVKKEQPQWREYIDLEHAAAYDIHNYWTGLTDGTWKYIFFPANGSEQLFNLENDPLEQQQLAGLTQYTDKLLEWRKKMGSHLEERGPEFVANGVPIKRKSILYSPNMPSDDYGDYDTFMENQKSYHQIVK
ncbi:MAG: arylsulfatase [Aestuariibaculum sp.]